MADANVSTQQAEQGKPTWRDFVLPPFLAAFFDSVTEVLAPLPPWARILVFLSTGLAWYGAKRIKHVWKTLSTLRKSAPGLLGAARIAVAVMAGIGVAFAFSLIVDLSTPEPCAPATEIRMITAAETLWHLTEKARQYEKEQLADGCAPVRVTVAEAPALGRLIDALNSDWERQDTGGTEPYVRLEGLQPDGWIASSEGEAQLVEAAVRDPGLLTIGAPVAGDQLVLAMLPGAARRVERELKAAEGVELRQAWQVVTGKLGMRVARPYPETSGAALSGAADMREAGLEQAERGMLRAPLPSLTVTKLLCAFHARRSEQIALFIPAHSVADYNDAQLTAQAKREGCPEIGLFGSDRLEAVRLQGMHALDYPFVSMRWPRQHSAARQAVVDHFASWLRAHPLFSESAPPDSYESRSLTETRRRLDTEIRPSFGLHVLVDMSGSARELLRAPASAAIRALPDVLGPKDRVSVSGLAAGSRAGPARLDELAREASLEEMDEPARAVEAAQFRGWDAAISAALEKVGGDEPHAVVVLTDGRLDNEEPGDAATTVGRALQRAESVTGLSVLVVGGGTCRVTQLKGTAKPYACRAVAEVPQALADTVLTAKGWR
ncbi:substrate-binding domain-containing protein [Nonomuraea soli]|uniref:VWA domain-containing protein n=1 Tax=Nonomuraea soli TaxID=1032476 RepID=A0A7W0HT40_9ACTN|nr:substrate-binding domain-containing protein [Nonomuraea soli]MBA2894713.1 hypothetical protein [Nonomuraea soli]